MAADSIITESPLKSALTVVQESGFTKALKRDQSEDTLEPVARHNLNVIATKMTCNTTVIKRYLCTRPAIFHKTRVICPVITQESKVQHLQTVTKANTIATVTRATVRRVASKLKSRRNSVKPPILRKAIVVCDVLSRDFVETLNVKVCDDDLDLLWQRGQDYVEDIDEESKAKIEQVRKEGPFINYVTQIQAFSDPPPHSGPEASMGRTWKIFL